MEDGIKNREHLQRMDELIKVKPDFEDIESISNLINELYGKVATLEKSGVPA